MTIRQTDPKLRLEHVTKQFAVRGSSDRFTAIDDISIDLAEGEFLVLVGPSGCGKSTLLDLLGGLSEPTSGRILLDGREISGPGLDRGIVFQQYALLPWRTARSNIEFGLEAKGLQKKERRNLADRYLELVGLHGFGDLYPHELSGGMKQRVAIARSLAFDPEVLLMDEPFAALDAQTRESLQDELLRIWRETGKTILFITHGIDEAVYLGQRVAVLTSRPGRIKTVVDIEIDRGVDDVRSGDAFRRHRHDIWSELHSEVERGLGIETAAVVPTITTEKVKHVQH
ncbi:ABC transporter ATP-binding protein [Rhodococcus sp. F64268]|uniref:ABC transporter ATP-binding protein n=1 Tax=unclassified Rhodococcus (in: high G+C Gram-positive bacteria) TaxID=192944 RepID=UPI001FF21BF1|nr:ABC transporter ATP-binding protein [Rhodococcus sp. F64268]MCK0089433.1 ABC transporter ATP-binding protein [Rhodococcus sp. F64268]